MILRTSFLVLAMLCVGLVLPAAAVDNDADIVYLRKDCAGLDNCFTSGNALWAENGWIWTMRQPTASDPLLVDVGPGQFDAFRCLEQPGHVTLRGAGRLHTVLRGQVAGGNVGGDVVNCDRLEFIDMAFHGTTAGFFWRGGTDTTWTNVDIVGLEGGDATIGWYEFACDNGQGEKSLHYFFGSRIIARGKNGSDPEINVAYKSECSETWFYGGELLWESSMDKAHYGHVIQLGDNADFRAFGSTIRAALSGSMPGVGAVGVTITSNDHPNYDRSVFHMHGGIISMNAPNAAGGYLSGIEVYSGGFAHTPATAYSFNAGQAKPYRVWVDGQPGSEVQAPFLWQSGAAPPHSSLESLDGQDVYVETDCDATGNCDGVASEPHMMIYAKERCQAEASSPWFDIVTGRCRGVVGVPGM